MWRKLGCIILIVVVLAVAGVIIYRQVSGKGFKLAEPKPKGDEKPLFEAARKGDLKITVEATGATEPITDIEVKSEATGRIIELFVEEGDHVAAGDMICKLDQSNQLLVVHAREIDYKSTQVAYDQAKNATATTSRSQLETALAGAEAALTAAKETLANAKSTFERINYLKEKGYATQQELDNAREAEVQAEANVKRAESALADAKTQLEQFDKQSNQSSVETARLRMEGARVALDEAKKQLGDSVIYSPIPGIILEKPVEVGDSVVSINSAFGQGTTIVRVADLHKIKVRTSVDEIDIGKLKVGQSAEVRVDAFQDKAFTGNLTNIFPQGVTSSGGLTNFVVIIEVDNKEGLLLGNMTASVKIEAQVIKDKLLIPLAATRAGKTPDTTIVYVLKEGEDPFDAKAKTEEREVKLGDTDYVDVIVNEGLKEGEKVKVRGFETSIRFD